jgi:hypothetical protein
MISIWNISIIVQKLKITKFKRNILKNNYDFCFGFLKDSLKAVKL